MRNMLSSTGILSLSLCLASALTGCRAEPEQAGCPTGDEIRGQCAGVPAQALCDDDACTQDLACASVKTVGDDASLKDAIASAGSGDCIALHPGTYKSIQLPGGVSLLGRSAADVTVKGIQVGAGGQSTVRGLAVGEDGVTIASGAVATIEAVRIDGAGSAGLALSDGATVAVRASTISSSAADGVLLIEGATLTLEGSLIEANAGPGIRATCASDCDCPAPPDLVLRSSIVRENHVGGVLLFGAHALIESVDIQGTDVGDTVAFGLGGGGLSAVACSDLTAKDLHVFNNRSYGVLLDDSNAFLGDPASDPSVEITGNEIGVWAQHISQSHAQTVTLDGLTVKGNSAVGIGTSGDAVGLIICRSAILDTAMADVPVEGAGSKQVGDGLLWLGGSEIAIDGLSLSGNARASVVIDGEASGSMANVTLGGGDEEKGIVQQAYAGGAQPQVGANSPAITTSDTGLYSIPKAPAVPPKSF